LQESRSPGPGRDDGGANQTALDGAAGGVEHFGGDDFGIVAFENEGG
jgi:hypothetical protein